MADLKQQLNDYMSLYRVSQTAVAKAIGVSGGALSAWRSGKYIGDNKKLEQLVGEYLSRNENVERETSTFKKDFDFVPTSVYEHIRTGIELADLRGEIRPIVGDSGIGKTTALKRLNEERSNLIFVQVYRGMRKNRFLAKLCKAAGFAAKGSFDDLFEELAERLNGAGRLIVIDEAEHLPIDAIDALRRLNDFTGCGVALCGLPALLNAMKRLDYNYIYNRTAMPLVLNPLSKSDVSQLVGTILPNGADEGMWMECSHGVGRDLKFIVLESQRVAQLNDVPVNEKLVRTITKNLGRIYKS